MTKDTDIDPMRAREDFKKLLAGWREQLAAFSRHGRIPNASPDPQHSARLLVAGFQIEENGKVVGKPDRQGREFLADD